MEYPGLPAGLRTATPSDYDRFAAVLDSWWDYPILFVLPRLWLDHFHRTTLVAEGPDGELQGFLVTFASPSRPDEAYVHLVAIAPAHRGQGLGRLFYETFFAAARAAGRTTVSAVTSPENARSIAFHTAMGFTDSGPVPDHDGPGHDLMSFRRTL